MDEIDKMKETYKEEYIRKHSEAAYIEKLLKNAAWRKAHPKNMEGYAEKRKGSSGKSKTVILLGDLHLGAGSVDEDEIRALAKRYWSKSPIILLGDLCDLGLEKGYNWDNKFGPQVQMNLVEEIIKPLNIVAFCIANHEERVYKLTGLTPYISMFGMNPSHNIEINNRKIYFSHGTSAAQNMFNEHQKFIKWTDVDVVALGHSHALARISFLRGERLCHLVRTGGFLGRSRYVENAGFNPLLRGWCEYNTETNFVHLKAINEKTGGIFEI